MLVGLGLSKSGTTFRGSPATPYSKRNVTFLADFSCNQAHGYLLILIRFAELKNRKGVIDNEIFS
jgi:hypothetical protein